MGRVPRRPADDPAPDVAGLGVGVLAYAVAVFQPTSLGVAASFATERFGIEASALSSFAVLQLVTYAGMQIPVGVLVDRALQHQFSGMVSSLLWGYPFMTVGMGYSPALAGGLLSRWCGRDGRRPGPGPAHRVVRAAPVEPRLRRPGGHRAGLA